MVKWMPSSARDWGEENSQFDKGGNKITSWKLQKAAPGFLSSLQNSDIIKAGTDQVPSQKQMMALILQIACKRFQD